MVKLPSSSFELKVSSSNFIKPLMKRHFATTVVLHKVVGFDVVYRRSSLKPETDILHQERANIQRLWVKIHVNFGSQS